MQGTTNIRSSSGESEIHGATIEVTTSEPTLVGKDCLLKFNGVTIQTKPFNSSGSTSFSNIQYKGSYNLYATDGVDAQSTYVNVTADDIVDKTTQTIDMEFSELLPVANIGDVVTINGLDFMCIAKGDNLMRILYVGSLGEINQNSAIARAQSTTSTPYLKLAELYNVSNPALLNRTEATSTPFSQSNILYICDRVPGVNWWTSYTSPAGSGHGAFLNTPQYPGQYVDVNRNDFGYSCVPAFSISRIMPS